MVFKCLMNWTIGSFEVVNFFSVKTGLRFGWSLTRLFAWYIFELQWIATNVGSVNSHTTLKALVPIWTPKLSSVGLAQYLDRRLPRNSKCCWLFWSISLTISFPMLYWRSCLCCFLSQSQVRDIYHWYSTCTMKFLLFSVHSKKFARTVFWWMQHEL